MFTKIIVGLDGRDGGRDALALAAQLAGTLGSELVAVHAYHYEYFVSAGVDGALEAQLHQGALEQVEGELARAGVRATAVAVPDGSPARALHLAATRHHGDLIVVGSAHRGRLGRVLAGDVTAGTLHGSPCPVLVAPAGYAGKEQAQATIGVGFDASRESRAAAAFAHDLARALGARLRVIEVVEPGVPGGPFPAYQPDWTEHARMQRETAQERVDALVAELGEIASGTLAFGDPAIELAYEGNRLDLLVVGSRDYGPIRRLVLGSTSSKLVHQAPCPVLVLARTASDELGEADVAVSAEAAPRS
jgi:nucleotide-binding universal stress UspA family protein